MKSLRSQLIVSHILPLLVIIPLLGLLLLYIVETQVVLANLTLDLAAEAAVLAQIATEQATVFENQAQAEFFARAAGAQYEHNVALYRADGSEWAIVVEENSAKTTAPDSGDLEILSTGRILRRATTNLDPSQATAEAFAPVFDAQKRLTGIIRVAEHVDRVNARLTQMRLLILGTTAGALLVAVAVGTWLASRTARRLDAVTNAIASVAEGAQPPLPDRSMPREFRRPFDAVEELQARLRASEESRKRLLANLVHELGRPLGALQAAIHALQQGADKDPALRNELLQGMDGQVERLKPLLDNLASLHGELSGSVALNKSSVVLRDWLPKVAVTWQEAAEQKGLRWSSTVQPNLPPVSMDADRIAQVMGNLLANAIKYTPEGGAIELSAQRRGAELELSVQDTGIGIAPEDRAHIFDPFYRGNLAQPGNPNRFPQGMGLGLAISRDLVQAHGGHIEVESEVGKGSRFNVLLPLDAQADGQTAAGNV